jgi:glutamate N-acetyltransferase/amino-acid N-acetyltransferase
MARLAARKLRISIEDVLVASTGTIGTYLPVKQIEKGIKGLALSQEHGHELARAIMTTDTSPKEIAGILEIGEKNVIIGGIAKGAGMIHPNMATLLCFLGTDASVDGDLLQAMLRRAVDVSFNMLTIDGDTSPNDTVVLLANGLAGNEMIRANTPQAETFQDALQNICVHLCKSMAGDGEGSTRLIEVTVEGAMTIADARIAARTVAGSPLVKTAIHGCDPNWGRVIVALGRSGAEVAGSKVDLYLGAICIMKEGHSQSFDVEQAKAILCRSEVPIRICLNLGTRMATAWGCDLSEEYVTINSTHTT